MRSNNLLEHVYLCLRKYLWIWLGPMILGLVLSGIYNKLLATKTYTARQSLILRDDLLGDAYKPSRFESEESLLSAQETILEIARKPQVVKAVLDQLGPASSFSFSRNYPSDETIEDVQGNISLSAPNGAEFGKTEAVVLSVKTVTAERSRKFVNLLLDEIDSKLSEVRLLRLDSMRNELAQAGENALKSLNTSSQRLQELEMSFGAEITTIRGLNDPQAGGGFDLKLNQIRLEQRQAEAQLSSAIKQRELLQQARRDGGVEFVTSNELLQLQPALQGIMTNLSTAMAQMAIDEGRYTSLHPQLQRSQRAVKMQKQQLFDSIGTTVKGLDSQIETLSALKQRLGDSIVRLETRLKELSEQRVPYATLEEEVKKKTEVYNDVQGQLAQVESYATSTESVAMLTRVDDPQVSSRPDQIGASTAGLVGAAIGLMLGLGLVALISPPFVDPRTSQTPSDPNFSNATATVPRDPRPASSPQPNATVSTTETHAESRLKSVTARQQRSATGSLSSKLTEIENETGTAGQSEEPEIPDSVIPDSVAQHMAAMKQRIKDGFSTKEEVQDKPDQRSNVSSDDVIAELKKLRGDGGQEPTGKTSADSDGKSELVSVDRIRSPRVPESITKGRITAESLLQSTKKNKDSHDQDVQTDSSSKEKIAPVANAPAASKAGADQIGGESLESRIPSITDYARSLDRKLGSTEGDRIADSIDNLTSEPSESSSRASNVRPLDIARSLEDPNLHRVPVDNVQPNENSADAITPQRRSESISDYVDSMDSSVAGLVQGVKGADVEQTAVRAGDGSVVPAEKIAAKPLPVASAEPVPREGDLSSSIPAQIRKLSDSFSSFARPSDSQ